MIAIPVKTNKENPVVSTSFGIAKWCAYVEGDSVTIEANSTESIRVVVEQMAQKGIDQIILH